MHQLESRTLSFGLRPITLLLLLSLFPTCVKSQNEGSQDPQHSSLAVAGIVIGACSIISRVVPCGLNEISHVTGVTFAVFFFAGVCLGSLAMLHGMQRKRQEKKNRARQQADVENGERCDECVQEQQTRSGEEEHHLPTAVEPLPYSKPKEPKEPPPAYQGEFSQVFV